MSTTDRYDIIVIGSGIGGATLVNRVAQSSANILILERGRKLPHTQHSRDSSSIFLDGHYRPREYWLDGKGEPFSPGNYYYIGGNSKFYGGAMFRYRKEDFGELVFDEGISPAWPISYEDLAPYYCQAESLYRVHGTPGEDPTEPPGIDQYPFPPVPDEPSIAKTRKRLARSGYRPFSIPLAIDIEQWLQQGSTPWDAFPGSGQGKFDAETAALNPVLTQPNVTLWDNTRVERLHTDSHGGEISHLTVERNGDKQELSAATIVLAAGAVNSAALLLRSANKQNPNGLANSSDMVGRHFMNHNCSAILAINPLQRNSAIYQKALAVNDFYFDNGEGGQPLGNLQLLGKLNGTILSGSLKFVPLKILNWFCNRSVDWYAMSEDLPNPESRVQVNKDGQITLDWKRSNMSAHTELVKKAKQVLKSSGFPIVISKPFDRRTPSHQCGTVRMGSDPKTSPLDTWCRSYDQKNLYVVDASFLPTSAAVNPALTIAAQALRVADRICEKHFPATPEQAVATE